MHCARRLLPAVASALASCAANGIIWPQACCGVSAHGASTHRRNASLGHAGSVRAEDGAV
jgi:hypothetical protein